MYVCIHIYYKYIYIINIYRNIYKQILYVYVNISICICKYIIYLFFNCLVILFLNLLVAFYFV